MIDEQGHGRLPEAIEGIELGALEVFQEQRGLILAMFTWPMVQLPNGAR
jgi:hypothetical protein